MSNPLINRWGFNLFWYNFWYTDKNSFLQNSLDSIITKLLFIYINYGLLFQKNPFFSNYWYKKNILLSTNLYKKYDLKYFRIMEHKNRITGELTRFYTRIAKKDVYYSKFWVLKYQNWIIIHIHSFQPLKKKKLIKKNRKYGASTLPPYFNLTEQTFFFFFRYKIYLSFLLNNYLIKKNMYYFF